jgi:hypothetical protein
LNLMDMLRNRLRQRPAELTSAQNATEERRGARRHDVDLEVTLSGRGRISMPALLFNISRSGAAIRIHGVHVPVPEPWPVRLKHGDELWVLGVLDDPIFCWVVAVDSGILRVHFSLEEDMQLELRQKFPFL